MPTYSFFRRSRMDLPLRSWKRKRTAYLVIASKNCGNVVENGVNGIILDEPSAACIAHAIRDCIASPDRLEKLASASRVRDKFTIEALANQLQRWAQLCRNST